TLRIIGWSSLIPAVDFGGMIVEPSWLAGGGIGTLWGVKPIVTGGNGQCPTDTTCPWMFVVANPASSLSFGSSRRWVLVTGHIDDPASSSCKFLPGGLAGNGPLPPNVYARQACRAMFVVTHIQNTTAPTG
ncbi:MAG TPA: hypothetical protein VET90_08030, partial [Candidatus Binatus sp.]|nr:hypothetical protein [Candidatus Binatus sp.]